MGYLSEFDAWYAERQASLERKIREVMDDVNPRYTEVVYRRIQEEFALAVQAFYDSYSPKAYRRNRSLFKILDMDDSDNGLSLEFDPSRMTPYRSGYRGEDGLYQTVFKEGWHGGAKDGPEHPSPGVAYWRAGKNFSRWGRRAKISIPAPFDDFRQRLQDYANFSANRDFEKVFWECAREHGLS